MTTLNPVIRNIADGFLIAGGLDFGTRAVTNDRVKPIDDLTGNNDVARNILYGLVGASAVYVLVDKIVAAAQFRKLRR